MEIRLNGETRTFEGDSLLLTDLLTGIGLQPDAPGIAVAINWEVVQRAAWAGRVVVDGDEVEVITARQGG